MACQNITRDECLHEEAKNFFLDLFAALLCGLWPAGAVRAVPATDESGREAHIQLSREAATEGMVLLKNDNNALPIQKNGSVALFGPGQIDFIKGGWGSGDVKSAYVRNLLQGMQIKDEEGKIQLNHSLASRYEQNKDFSLEQEIVDAAAQESDTAVVTISRNSGEAYDRNSGKGDYELSDSEINMLDLVCAADFQHIVVVLNIGGVIDTSWIAKYPAIDSVLVAWQPGMEGGLAAADILCGDVNPSGKLADTFAKSYADYPSSAGFHENDMYVNYTEDIYVGYRYFETFDPTYSRVNYEFGFGLSYTDFSIDNVQVSEDEENIRVTADVKNTGDVAGKEVVQVYYGAPIGKLGNPAKELAAFQKTNLIQPGETETVSLSFAIEDMASYDDLGKIQKSAYVLEKGDYNIYVGNSVKNAGQQGVRYTYKQAEDEVTKQLSEQVAPIQLKERLINDGSGQEKYETLPYRDDWAHQLTGREGVVIQAEKYYKKQTHVTLQFNEEATNGGMYISPSDQGDRWITYAVNVPNDGTYNLTMGMGNGGNISRNGLKLYAGYTEQLIPQVNLPSTGGQFDLVDVGALNLELNKGINFVSLVFTDTNFAGLLDTVTIRPGAGEYEDIPIDPAKRQSVAASGVTRIEAEDYSAVEGNKDIGPEDSIVNGEKIGVSVKALDTEGAVLEYALDVEKAGQYNMVMHASSGSGDKNDCMDVLVNGVKQEGIVCNLPETAVEGNQWFNFIDVGPYGIELPAGEVTLRFEFKNFGNLDSFTLEPVAQNSLLRLAAAPAAAAPAAAVAAPAAQAEEKITFQEVYEDPSLMDAFIDQLTDEEIYSMTHGHGSALPEGAGSIGYLPEYGVPGVETTDGPAGVRGTNPTAFPIGTLIACTWNPELVERVGKAAGQEAKEMGADIWLAPALNIHRNPMTGRNFEYYSEDPLVSGKMAAAITRGAQSEKVAVTLKHFAANNKETYRGYSDSRVSERALREIYLKGFEICIAEADPWCLMSSYNSINGVETSENPELLTNILRNEWGFKGMVMTDWWNDSVTCWELKAGNEVRMASAEHPLHVYDAVRAGWITRDELERTARRILEMILKTNAMDRMAEEAVWHTVASEGPSRVKASEYSWKSDGIGIEECKDEDGGTNPKNTYANEWLRYNIRVEKSGTYTFKVRFASPGGGSGLDILVDGQKVGHFDPFPGTGDWQIWQTSDPITFQLEEGDHDLRVNILQDGANVNWFELEREIPELEVTIQPRNQAVKPGESIAFTAKVGGTAATGEETVSWTVTGGAAGTTIDDQGKLTVAADETAETLQVTAVIDGTEISDMVTVTVGNPVLDKALAAAEQAVNSLKATNETTADEILTAAQQAVDNNKVDVSWKDPFTLTKATDEASGSITGSLELSYNGDSVLLAVSLTIPSLSATIVPGDLDKDEEVTIADVMEACKVMARESAGTDPTDDEIARGDLDGDGEITIADVMEICKILARQG